MSDTPQRAIEEAKRRFGPAGRRQRPTPPPSPYPHTVDELLTSVAGINARLRDINARLRRSHGITLDELHLLTQIQREPCRHTDATMRPLAATIGLTPSGLSRIVARLVDKDLLARNPNPADGRGGLLTITSEGERRLHDARADLTDLLTTAAPPGARPA